MWISRRLIHFKICILLLTDPVVMLQKQTVSVAFQCLYLKKTLKTTITCTIKNNFVSLLPAYPVCTNIVNGNREALNKNCRCCLMGLVISSCNKALTYLFMGNCDTGSPMKPRNILNPLSYYQMYKLWNNSSQFLFLKNIILLSFLLINTCCVFS